MVFTRYYSSHRFWDCQKNGGIQQKSEKEVPCNLEEDLKRTRAAVLGEAVNRGVVLGGLIIPGPVMFAVMLVRSNSLNVILMSSSGVSVSSLISLLTAFTT